jgi:methylated-DNA-protein-cysteine methyltransferase-like protein
MLLQTIPYGKVTSYGAIAKAWEQLVQQKNGGLGRDASHNMDDVPHARVVE